MIPQSSESAARSSPVSISLIPARAGYEHLTAQERDRQPAVATRRALLQRLSLLEAIAPSAPVSFLLVAVVGLADLDDIDPSPAPGVISEVAASLSRLTDPTDLVGRFENTTFGGVLQGRSAGSAALMAARIGHHLNLLPLMHHPAGVRVAIASGIGAGADALIDAAAGALVCEGYGPVS